MFDVYLMILGFDLGEVLKNRDIDFFSMSGIDFVLTRFKKMVSPYGAHSL